MTPHEMNIVVLSRYLRSELALAGLDMPGLQTGLAALEAHLGDRRDDAA